MGRGFVKGFDMLDLGSYPGVVRGSGAVYGEVYEVEDPAVLERVDDAEGVGEGLYSRERCVVLFGGELSEMAQLYVYNKPAEGRKRVGDGDWARYKGRSGLANLFLAGETTIPEWLEPINTVPAKIGDVKGVIYTVYENKLRRLGRLKPCRITGLEDGKTYYGLTLG